MVEVISRYSFSRFPGPFLENSIDVPFNRSPCISSVHTVSEQLIVGRRDVTYMRLNSKLDRLLVEPLRGRRPTNSTGIPDACVLGYQGAGRIRALGIQVSDALSELRNELFVPVFATQSGSHTSLLPRLVILQAFPLCARQSPLVD